jgi:hypothetical protein
MQVKSLGERYLVRLDPGEEVVEHLKQFADEYRIGFGAIRAIGTFERATLGYFDVEAKAYRNQAFDEPLEVLNLSGNISQGEDGERIVHLHVTVGRADYSALGGHVVEAITGPTLEVVVETEPTTIYRRHNPETDLMQWDLTAQEPMYA